MEIGNEISQKIRSAIKAKLVDLGAYVDDELPDYIMVMVANKKSQAQMTADLNLFLGDNTERFTAWLHSLLMKLKSIATDPAKEAAMAQATGEASATDKDADQNGAGEVSTETSAPAEEQEEPELTLRPDKDEFAEEQIMSEKPKGKSVTSRGAGSTSSSTTQGSKTSHSLRARRPAALAAKAPTAETKYEPMTLSDIDTGIRASLYCLEFGTRAEARGELMKLQEKLRGTLQDYEERLNHSEMSVKLLQRHIISKGVAGDMPVMEVEEDVDDEDAEDSEAESEADDEDGSAASEAESAIGSDAVSGNETDAETGDEQDEEMEVELDTEVAGAKNDDEDMGFEPDYELEESEDPAPEAHREAAVTSGTETKSPQPADEHIEDSQITQPQEENAAESPGSPSTCSGKHISQDPPVVDSEVAEEKVIEKDLNGDMSSTAVAVSQTEATDQSASSQDGSLRETEPPQSSESNAKTPDELKSEPSEAKSQSSMAEPQSSEDKQLLSDAMPQTFKVNPQSSEAKLQSSEMKSQSSEPKPDSPESPESSQSKPESSEIHPESSDVKPESCEAKAEPSDIKADSSSAAPQSSEGPCGKQSEGTARKLSGKGKTDQVPKDMRMTTKVTNSKPTSERCHISGDMQHKVSEGAANSLETTKVAVPKLLKKACVPKQSKSINLKLSKVKNTDSKPPNEAVSKPVKKILKRPKPSDDKHSEDTALASPKIVTTNRPCEVETKQLKKVVPKPSKAITPKQSPKQPKAASSKPSVKVSVAQGKKTAVNLNKTASPKQTKPPLSKQSKLTTPQPAKPTPPKQTKPASVQPSCAKLKPDISQTAKKTTTKVKVHSKASSPQKTPSPQKIPSPQKAKLVSKVTSTPKAKVQSQTITSHISKPTNKSSSPEISTSSAKDKQEQRSNRSSRSRSSSPSSRSSSRSKDVSSEDDMSSNLSMSESEDDLEPPHYPPVKRRKYTSPENGDSRRPGPKPVIRRHKVVTRRMYSDDMWPEENR